MDDDPPRPGGIEKALEAGGQFSEHPFPAPEMPPPMQPAPPAPPMSAGVGPQSDDLFSRPHLMEGGWNVSLDRTHWWNGVTWVPGLPPGSRPAMGPTSPLAALLGLLALVVFGMIAFGICQSMPTGPGFGGGISP